ncbi:MAG: CDP-archaeol synthase [Gammaproteobacteria bacterium]|nr:CDP-archaeol synthase [Gammaproteobacteria bacterium]
MNTEFLSAALTALEPPFKMLALLIIANGAPILGKKIFGAAFSRRLDGGAKFRDGRPLFGPSKTIRGVVLSLGATALAAGVLGFDWTDGALIAALAMLGDLTSSFIKRRLGLPPSSMALGLDQIPESLVPSLAFKARWGLTAWDIGGVVLVFIVLELLLSRLLFGLHLRDRPY